MASSEVFVREIAHGSRDYEEGKKLRQRVLRDPLGITLSEADLAEEATARHLAAFEGERLVGYLILFDLGNGVVRMRQVAVDFDRHRRGVGRALVARSEELARASGYRTMLLHARDVAVPFYLAQGYEIFDDPFVEVTIPHRKMRKRLD